MHIVCIAGSMKQYSVGLTTQGPKCNYIVPDQWHSTQSRSASVAKLLRELAMFRPQAGQGTYMYTSARVNKDGVQ